MKQVQMFKNGEWVKWDGSDVSTLIVTETMTLEELKKHPDLYKKYKDRQV